MLDEIVDLESSTVYRLNGDSPIVAMVRDALSTDVAAQDGGEKGAMHQKGLVDAVANLVKLQSLAEGGARSLGRTG